MKHAILIAGLLGLGVLAGCAQRPSLFPNSDKSLNRKSAQFAADAARRHPYKSNAPRGPEAQGLADYNLMSGRIQILNASDQDWKDVEVWVNHDYVCWLPIIEKGKARVKTINFKMLYDANGNHFRTNGGKNPLETVEVYCDGKMHNLPTKLTD
ncbi:MAG TPA: hypothetical protein VFC78_01600 [Tepidisphaeraceae bacterium]|nr:hypothetical protein [Tepidisphaeraceae bacterium]